MSHVQNLTGKEQLAALMRERACLIALKYLAIGQTMDNVWLLVTLRLVDQETKHRKDLAPMEHATNALTLRGNGSFHVKKLGNNYLLAQVRHLDFCLGVYHIK